MIGLDCVGVVLFGRTSRAAAALGGMLRAREGVAKCYVALVSGDARNVPGLISKLLLIVVK